MHFKINKDNIITEFHIEKWDKKVLGRKLTDKINSYKGKHYKDFILFTLKNRLFLKLRILYLMREKTCIYFWGCSAVHANKDRQAIEMMVRWGVDKKELQYAKFYLEGQNESNFISVLYENVLRSVMGRAGYEPKRMIFKLDGEEIKDITLNFNIARNSWNIINMLTKYDPDNYRKDEVLITQIKKLAFIAVDAETGELRILKEREVEKIDKDSLLRYSIVASVQPYDEESERRAKQIMNKISSIKGKIRFRLWN